jgi:hypothetical protein
MRDGWGGAWVLPVLVAAFGGMLVAAVPRHPVPALPRDARVVAETRTTAFIDLQLSEVLLPDGTGDGAVLLVDPDGRWTLPLFVSRAQAERLDQGASGPEDSPARLLETALGQLGRPCTAVELDEVDGQPAGAIVLGDGRRLDVLGGQLEAALGLAVRSNAPVRASRRLLEARGIARGAPGEGPALPTGLRPSRSL